jgi:hypothetical protein
MTMETVGLIVLGLWIAVLIWLAISAAQRLMEEQEEDQDETA